MGLVMSPGSVVAQLDGMNQNLSKALENAEAVLKEVSDLEETTDVLQGESYDSIRDYYENVHIPVLHGFIMYAEELIQENYDYKMYIGSGLSGIGYVDEDGLREDLEKLRKQMDRVRGLMNRMEFLSSVGGLLESMEKTERLIEKKLEQIENFLDATVGLYEGSETYAGILKSGIECMQTAVLHGNMISYMVNPLNSDWAAELEEKWIEKEIKEKELFVNAMSGQFGFDDETALILYELYYRMQQEGVENINQKYFGILSSYVYSNSAGVSIKNTIWHEIAGTYDKETLEGMLAGYGFSEEEIALLECNITDNYIKSCINKEKDNPYFQKSDLSHMSVICATMLNDYDAGWEMAGGFAGWLCNGIFNLEANAGYIGDVYGTAGNGAKLTQDDYKADLDAVNLCSRMEACGNGIRVIGQYYEGISSGEINRADEFIINLGEGDYDKGVDCLRSQVEANQTFLTAIPVGNFTEMGLKASINVLSGGGFSLAGDIYSEKNKIQKNFYESLLEGSNEYQEKEQVNIDLAENGERGNE